MMSTEIQEDFRVFVALTGQGKADWFTGTAKTGVPLLSH